MNYWFQGAIKSICGGLQKLAKVVGKEKNIDAISRFQDSGIILRS